MKRISISCMAALASVGISAQPVIDATPFINSHGTAISRVLVDYQPPSDGGEDTVWDYSDLEANDELSYNISLPAGIPGADLAPQATHAIALPAQGQFVFYEITEDFMSTVFVKVVSPQGEIDIPFDPARVNAAFPIEQGSEYTEPYARTTDFGEGIFEIEEGEVSGITDGYGTLILPDGEYENVLRMVISSAGTVVAVVNGDTVNSVLTTTVTEMFLNEDYPFGLLQFESTSVGGQMFNGGSYEKNLTVSSREAEAADLNPEVFPNPATDRVRFRLNLPESAASTLSLFSLDGKQIIQQNLGFLSQGSQTAEFSVGDLPPGIYIAEVQSGDFRAVKKLAVGR